MPTDLYLDLSDPAARLVLDLYADLIDPINPMRASRVRSLVGEASSAEECRRRARRKRDNGISLKEEVAIKRRLKQIKASFTDEHGVLLIPPSCDVPPNDTPGIREIAAYENDYEVE